MTTNTTPITAIKQIKYIMENDDCQETCPAYKYKFKDRYGECNCHMAVINIATKALAEFKREVE